MLKKNDIYYFAGYPVSGQAEDPAKSVSGTTLKIIVRGKIVRQSKKWFLW